MRVISGSARGTKLFSLEGLNTRPTLDKVKEAIFSIIQMDVADAVVLDLFSGSGALGIEAVSRGSLCAALVDSQRAAIEVIKKNIEKTGFNEKLTCFHDSYEGFLNNKAKSYLDKMGESYFTLVFLDPPYGEGLIEKSIEMIQKNKLVGEYTLFVCEADLKDCLPEKIGEFSIIKEKKYGKSKAVFYARRD